MATETRVGPERGRYAPDGPRRVTTRSPAHGMAPGESRGIRPLPQHSFSLLLPPDRPTHVTTSLLPPRHRTMTTRSVFGSSVLVPLAEGAETVPGGLPARLAHLQGPRMLGAGVAHACPTSTTDNTSASVGKTNVATDSDDATTSFPVAPGTPPTTLRANAHVLRAPGGSLLMGPWHGAFARADEARGGRATREDERRRPRSPEDESSEDESESARRATHLKDRPAIDAAHAEHIAELAFCGVDEMRLDEGRAVSLELVAEDAVAGRISRSGEIDAFAFPRRHRVRSAPPRPRARWARSASRRDAGPRPPSCARRREDAEQGGRDEGARAR